MGAFFLPEVMAVSDLRVRARRGAGLVDALVAVTILVIGVLALGATGAASSRMVSEARGNALAASLASSRLEVLHDGSCAASAGLDSAPGIAAYWTRVSAANAAEEVDSVVIRDALARNTRVERFQSAAPCR